MGWDWGGMGSGAIGGAGTGATIGGPWGAAIGAGAGGLMGGLSGLKGGEEGGPEVQNFMGSIPNTQNALGGQTWGIGPDGRPTSNFGFTGQAADTFNALQGGMNKAANYDPTQARDAAIKSNYDQSMSRLNPRLLQQQSQFGAGAANSGLEPGTEAFNNANLQMQQGQNDALQTAMAGAIRQGNETQNVQMEQMRQPFLQAGSMLNMLGQQGANLGQPLQAAGMAQKAQDNALDRAEAGKAGKKGGAGGMLGGMGGKKDKGGGGSTSDYNVNFGGNGSISG